MGDKAFHLRIQPSRKALWERDLHIVKDALHIQTDTQAIITAMHLAALTLRKMVLATGEATCIHRTSEDTWALHIGDITGNTVEDLDSPEAALDLIIRARTG